MDITPFRPLIRSQADLERTWRHLMTPLDFSSPSLWLMLIEPTGQPVPHLIEIAETTDLPDLDEQGGLVEFLRMITDEVAAPGSRIGFLLSRPGRDGPRGGPRDCPRAEDRSWARVLYAAARAAGIGCEVVHVATDHTIVPVPADEVGLGTPA